MNLRLLITGALLCWGQYALCQSLARDSAHTFKIHRSIEIKTLYSRSNMLYEGKNPLRLDGIDSAHADKYFLSVSHFIPIQREGNKFYLDINLYALSHDIVTIPGSITVFIYEINLLDTVLMGSQEMDIVGGQLPQPTIMVGENALTPERESKKELLANPSFSLTSQYSDYSSCFKISGFSITIGSQTYFCKSYSLSAEIINALKNYKGKYVTVPNVYATSPDGFTVQFVSSSK